MNASQRGEAGAFYSFARSDIRRCCPGVNAGSFRTRHVEHVPQKSPEETTTTESGIRPARAQYIACLAEVQKQFAVSRAVLQISNCRRLPVFRQHKEANVARIPEILHPTNRD